MWGRITLSRGCGACRGAGVSTLLPRAGTGRGAARQARPAGPPSTACPLAPPPGPCRAGHTAGTRHTHTPRESTPRGPLADRNAQVPRGVTHHLLCWAPRNHTVPSSPCPSTADFVNFLIFILFTYSLLWLRWVLWLWGLSLAAAHGPQGAGWRVLVHGRGACRDSGAPAAVPSRPAGSQDGVCEPVLGALAGKLRGDGCPCHLKHGVRRTGYLKPAGQA